MVIERFPSSCSDLAPENESGPDVSDQGFWIRERGEADSACSTVASARTDEGQSLPPNTFSSLFHFRLQLFNQSGHIFPELFPIL